MTDVDWPNHPDIPRPTGEVLVRITIRTNGYSVVTEPPLHVTDVDNALVAVLYDIVMQRLGMTMQQ
jgi:hypothetical protein